MKIGLFAQKVNLSTHTLRYYEKRGLIKVDRDQSGQRSYDENDLAWVQFIQRLKDTGMHLKDIQRYADLRYQGDGSLKERLEMLQKHRSFVQEQIKNWQTFSNVNLGSDRDSIDSIPENNSLTVIAFGTSRSSMFSILVSLLQLLNAAVRLSSTTPPSE